MKKKRRIAGHGSDSYMHVYSGERTFAVIAAPSGPVENIPEPENPTI
jgi:hypothetical protein